MIPHEYIEELTRRTDIVELVGSYVQLKRRGAFCAAEVACSINRKGRLKIHDPTRIH